MPCFVTVGVADKHCAAESNVFFRRKKIQKLCFLKYTFKITKK